MRVYYVLLIAVLLMAFGAGPACADITLTDGNSTAYINPGSQAGMYDWLVDGTDVMYQQWFWFRIGDGVAQSIDTLNLVAVQNDLNIVTLKSLPPTGGGSPFFTMTFTLYGGLLGSGTADIAESIRMNNTTGAPLDLHFFQYSDFDIPLFTTNSVALVNPNIVRQLGSSGYASETSALPTPNRYELNQFASTLNALNGVAGYDLQGPVFSGPGDVTWAFQWDALLPTGGSLIISKDKHIALVVPEPASILGLGTVLFLLGSRLRRKRA